MQVSLTNLIANGSMETNITGWAASQGSPAPSRLASIPAPGHGEYGSACLQVSGNINYSQGGGTNKASTQYQNIAVVSGRKYYMRMRARFQTPTTTDSVQFNNNGTDIGHAFAYIGNSQWGFVDYIWTANSATLGLRPQFSVIGASGQTSTTFQIDNAMLIDLTTPFGEGSEPTAGAMRSIIDNYVGPNGGKGYFDGTVTVDMPDPPMIDPLSIVPLNALMGRSFSHQVNLVSGTGSSPFIFSINNLPPGNGLSIDNTGLITGTIGLTEGGYPFTVSVIDSNGLTTTENFTLNVGELPVINTLSIPSAIYNEPYSFTFDLSGSDPITVSLFVASGTLPTGLSIDPVTRTISGIATVDGQSCRITMIAYNPYDNTGNVTRTFDFSVTSVAHIVTPPTLPSAVVGQLYQGASSGFQFTASGVQPITWELIGGFISEGMTFDSITATLYGSPSLAGVSSFTLRASNNLGHHDVVFTITVNQLPIITSVNLNYARLETDYSYQLEATGTTPITWSLDSGSLPPGMYVTTNGLITGQPLVAGTFNPVFRATNIAGTATKSFTIQSGSALGVTTTSPLRVATRNVNYGTLQFTAAGIDIFYTTTWAVVAGGTGLPTGMSFSSSGVLSGTPTGAAGTYIIPVRVTNGSRTADTSVVLVVGEVPTINPPTSFIGGADRPFTTVLSSTSTASVTWEMVTPPITPPGSQITLSPQGVLSWLIPSVGNYTFVIRAINQFGNSSNTNFTLQITTPSIHDVFPPDDGQVLSPQIYLIINSKNTAHLSDFLPYTFSASGDPPLTWSLLPPTDGLSDGAIHGLPPELGFDPLTATIDGFPITPGRYKFDIRVENVPAQSYDQHTFWITVVEPPSILTTVLNSGNVGTSYIQALQASGTPPMSWEILPPSGGETGLPPGIGISGSILSGIFTTQGNYVFSGRATNITGNNYSATRQFTIAVGPSGAPVITTGASLTAIKGIPYTLNLEANGTSPITYSLMSGAFPSGIGILNGVISGTALADGDYDFVIQASNSEGLDTRQFHMTVNDPPSITTQTLPQTQTNEVYYAQLQATGTTPISWQALNPTGGETGFPSELTLNPQTGEISGEITSGGIYTFRIRAINIVGNDTKYFEIVAIHPVASSRISINGVELTPEKVAFGGTLIKGAAFNGVLLF